MQVIDLREHSITVQRESAYRALLGSYMLAFLVVSVFALWLWTATTARDAQLAMHADCVADTARAEGYSGNPHGAEAWQLFSGMCE